MSANLPDRIINAMRNRDLRESGLIAAEMAKEPRIGDSVARVLLDVASKTDFEVGYYALAGVLVFGLHRSPRSGIAIRSCFRSRFPAARLRDLAAKETASSKVRTKETVHEIRIMMTLIRLLLTSHDSVSFRLVQSTQKAFSMTPLGTKIDKLIRSNN